MPLNPYEELRVAVTATAAQIKAAYRRRAKQTHPDKHPDDPFATARFQQVQEAYDILSDPLRRAAYDSGGDARPRNLTEQQARSTVVNTFFAVLAQHGLDRCIERTRHQLHAQRRAGRGTLADIEKSNKRLAAAKARFRCRDGDRNFLIDALDGSIAQNGEAIIEHKQKLAVMERAIAMLDAFEDIAPQADPYVVVRLLEEAT